MSYSNGLGNLQNLIGNLATTQSQNTKTTDQASVSTTTTNHSILSNLDATKLSSASGLVSHAVAGSDVRVAKVTALQQAISDGTYFVPASDVATSIIGSLLG